MPRDDIGKRKSCPSVCHASFTIRGRHYENCRWNWSHPSRSIRVHLLHLCPRDFCSKCILYMRVFRCGTGYVSYSCTPLQTPSVRGELLSFGATPVEHSVAAAVLSFTSMITCLSRKPRRRAAREDCLAVSGTVVAASEYCSTFITIRSDYTTSLTSWE